MRAALIIFLGACTPGNDMGDVPEDTSGEESLVPLEGFGDITGECGEIPEQRLTGPATDYFRNTLDFGSLEFDETALTEGGNEIYTEGNLGGSSLYSEIFAFEVLARCELASLVLTESEVVYVDANGKKTDLVVLISDVPLGVSITRAYGYPPEDPYTLEQAQDLLTSKFEGVQESTDNMAAENAWTKQILHVIAYTEDHADTIEEAYHGMLGTGAIGDTLLVVTATEGNDEYLY